MPALHALILGIIQGVTEFMPVSSSGHLVLVPWALGWEDPGLTFDTVTHLGTLVAVFICFRQDVCALFRGALGLLRRPRLEKPASRLLMLLVASTIPGAVLGYLLEEQFEQLFGSPAVVSGLLAVTAGMLLAGERFGRQQADLKTMRLRGALVIGLAQALAIAPGLSRSGATITAGLLRGFTRQDATRFSFLLSLPIILGAGAYRLLGLLGTGGQSLSLSLAIGFISAAVSGYLAIRFLLHYVREHSLRPLAYYCLVVAVAGLLLSSVRAV